MDWSEEEPTPTPARWGTPTLVPVTLTQGNKRMVGSLRPAGQARPKVLPMPTGFAAASRQGGAEDRGEVQDSGSRGDGCWKYFSPSGTARRRELDWD